MPPYLKNTSWLEAAIPWLCLNGISTIDFDEALTALIGQSVKVTVAGHDRSSQPGPEERAFYRVIATYGDKYPRSTRRHEKDYAELPAFYGFPAVHSQHLRTTNPIESTFAINRLRTA